MIELDNQVVPPEELSPVFEPMTQTMHNWIKQTDIDGGVRSHGPTTEER